jgi:hypothetical protein
MLVFTPDSSNGNSGPQSSVVIQKGQFSVPVKFGLMPGAYFITLYGYSEPSAGTEQDNRTPLFRDVNKEFEMPAKAHLLDLNITKEDLEK